MPTKTRREHKLKDTPYVREKQAKFAASMIYWRLHVARITRADLARRIGCHQQQIANIENGANHPSAALLYVLCREMGVEVFGKRP